MTDIQTDRQTENDAYEKSQHCGDRSMSNCMGSLWQFLDLTFVDHHNVAFKDVPTSIPKSDLLCVTMAVIHVAGQQFLAV